MLLRQDGRAGRDATDERQRQLRHAGQRERELPAFAMARFVERAQRIALESNAARGAADKFDHALAGQRLQVFFGGVGRLETQLIGDFGARGRGASARDGALDQVEDLLLAGGKLHGELHMWFLAALAGYPVPVFLTSF